MIGARIELMRGTPRLFGTDGVRGVAGRYPLDRETVWQLGRALGSVFSSRSGRPKILMGRDTRESSPWIASTLAAGLQASGVSVAFAGIITTPGVAFLTRTHAFTAGVMISASHNPFEDNGIKVLSGNGMKLPESLELEIERELEKRRAARSGASQIGLEVSPGLIEDYVGFLASLAVPEDGLARFRIVADCANGSAAIVAPLLFQRLGLEAFFIHAEPNGRNINSGCGSLYPQSVAEAAKRCGADLAVAFDGDADRAIFASSSGRVFDGDYVLFATAPFWKARGLLKGGAVVGTQMTNLGLEIALKSQGIQLKRTPVGDRFVLEEMLRSGINLGGEPSGHLIFSDLSLAGDGLVTLLQMLRLLAETGKTLDEIMRDYAPFPQIIRNVRVHQKKNLDSIPEVAEAVDRCQGELGERGRIIVRYSGTEPLARVMVEGEDAARVHHHANCIAGAIAAAVDHAE